MVGSNGWGLEELIVQTNPPNSLLLYVWVILCVSFEGRSKKDYKQHQVFSCLGCLN